MITGVGGAARPAASALASMGGDVVGRLGDHGRRLGAATGQVGGFVPAAWAAMLGPVSGLAGWPAPAGSRRGLTEFITRAKALTAHRSD